MKIEFKYSKEKIEFSYKKEWPPSDHSLHEATDSQNCLHSNSEHP